MSSRHLRRLLAVPLLALLGLGLTIALHAINERLEEVQQQSPLGGLNHEITDLAFQVRHATNQDSLWALSDVVVIDIDDASIQALGRTQTWPRSFTARILQHVNEGNPAAIGLDVLYTEPDTLSAHYGQLLERSGFERSDQILAAMSTDDQLAAALRTAGNVYLGLYDDQRTSASTPASVRRDLRVTEDSSSLARRLPPLSHPVLPIPPLRRAARGVAPIMLPNTGGVTRFYRIAHRLPDSASTNRVIPSFSVLMAADLLGVPLSSFEFTGNRVRLGNERTIPVDPSGHFRINWLGSDESIRRISYHKVLQETVPSRFFEDKVVFLGGSAAGLEDLKTTPVDEQQPGVLVHAQAFVNVINQAHLPEWSIWDLWPWLALGALPFLVVVLSIPPLYASVLTLLLAAIEFFGYLLYLFPAYGIILPVGTILTFTLLTFIGGVVFKYVTEEWEKQRLREAFATYVDASVVDQVTENPEALELGGEKKRLTVLFSDVRQFTTYSEHLDPQEVVTFLNRFFDRLTAAVFEQDGTVDKFIGDGMMAIFGAPLDTDEHASQACAAALSMSKALERMNEEDDVGVDDQEPDVPVSIGVGINTGEMVAGNIGSSRRFEYTVVGDAVNLAARLEPVNRLLGTRILVSDTTYDEVTPCPWTFRRMGSFRVKGREDAVTIYELMDPRRYAEPQALREQFETALDDYHQQKFDAARTHFEECQSIQSEDDPSQFYLDRCVHFLQNPSDYDAVIDLRNASK